MNTNEPNESSANSKNKLIKTYSVAQLAELFGVSPRTMRNRLKPHNEKIGERIGWYYTPRQIKIIFESIGYPPTQPGDSK